jgi:hypothetical protein
VFDCSTREPELPAGISQVFDGMVIAQSRRVGLPRSRHSTVDKLKERVTQMNIEHLAIRVRAEFQEMPGLRLTVRQAERLWGLAPDVCAQVVDVLVSRAILKRHGDTFSLAK